MSSKKPSISVPISFGENTRKALLEADLLDISFKIRSVNGTLLLPLTKELTENELFRLLGHDEFQIEHEEFESIPSSPRTLAEVMSDELSPSELELLPRAYDLIGDIAILEIPEELIQYKDKIGEAFRSLHKNVSVVLAKQGAISGTTRIRDYDLIAGEHRTNTTHIEYGCRIAVDLAKAYFSPRLLEEHNRIAKQVTPGETIIDMFTGVGPFPLHIAKETDAIVFAIDINPDAISLLKKSMKLNKFVGRITPIIADAELYVTENFDSNADRVIMNHPSGASSFVKAACIALKPDGIMHYYDFVGGDDPEALMISRLKSLIKSAGYSIDQVLHVRRVRDSAPYEYQMAVDVVIQ
ncbi:MAG: hypothetical protein GF411_06770 [Candidatus Lokiarchaeota archaeon]|nr:hypothetical protein [Candidatus Lokiarchaeota archaeon]